MLKAYLFAGIIVVLLSLPALAVALPPLYLDPVFKLWTEQNVTLSPWPWEYAVGFGFSSLLAVVGIMKADHRDPRVRFLFCWLVVTLLLVYSPFSLQRRLIEGFQFPLTVFAVLGLSAVLQRVGTEKQRRLFKVIFVAALVPTNLFLLFFLPLGALSQPDLTYLPVADVEAMQWLKANSRPLELVVAAPMTGNILPSWTGNRVYYGHPFETVRAAEKESSLREYFFGMNAVQRQSYLKENGVVFLYFGQRERELAGFNPYDESYLEPIYTNREVTIFKVVL